MYLNVCLFFIIYYYYYLPNLFDFFYNVLILNLFDCSYSFQDDLELRALFCSLHTALYYANVYNMTFTCNTVLLINL